MKRRLLLLSNSTNHGGRYLGHCESEVRRHFSGSERVLFVPFALHDRDAYGELARRRFAEMEIDLEPIHSAADAGRALDMAGGVFVGGGNTFRLLRELQERHLLEPLRDRVEEGMPYMGASAGTNLACPTIRTTNDMPIVEPRSFEALGLVSFQINPHYLDADPRSTHMGETRETRIREFLEENDAVVVGLREGGWLEVDGERVTVKGTLPARIFRRGTEPDELEPGSSWKGEPGP